MTISFMSLIAAQLVDRVDVRAGLLALAPMLLVGVASVVFWIVTERQGRGNVVPYAVLQAYSVIVLLQLAVLHPSRYTNGNAIYACSPATCWPRVSSTSTARSRADRRRERPHAQARGGGPGRAAGRLHALAPRTRRARQRVAGPGACDLDQRLVT